MLERIILYVEAEAWKMCRAHTSGKQTRINRNSLFPCILVAAERDGLEAYSKIKLNKRKNSEEGNISWQNKQAGFFRTGRPSGEIKG